MMSRRTRFVVPLLALAAGGAMALAGPYRAADSAGYESTNTYFLWFLQGADTLGQPVETVTAETHGIVQGPEGLELTVAMEGDGFASTTVYGIDDTGRVHAVDGVPVADVAAARVDVLPRIDLPAEGLRPGATWSDAVSASADRDFGPTFYRASRTYTVVGPVDFAGVEVVLAVGVGELALRQGGWQDAQQTRSWWQEVSGPVVDSVWFDVARGRMVASAAHMTLEGTGGFRAGDQALDIVSGLRSSVRRMPSGGAP